MNFAAIPVFKRPSHVDNADNGILCSDQIQIRNDIGRIESLFPTHQTSLSFNTDRNIPSGILGRTDGA
jgi:hypothetical protein